MPTNLIYDNLINSVVALRKELHAQPEVSEHEVITAKKIKLLIEKLHPTRILEGVGGAGIIIEYDSGQPGKNIMFRAELDALPIQEINVFPHQSLNKGISHKCGHDGHMSR
jgi:metal-dependent amidase/aminoacylase/carboxypeptidase family protein